MSILVSKLNPNLAKMTDSEIAEELERLEALRKVSHEYDDGQAIDDIDYKIFLLDDEQCARFNSRH